MNKENRNHRAFNELLHFVWNKSPFYRRLYSDSGIRERDLAFIDIEDIPIINKKMMMQNFDEMVSDKRIRMNLIKKWMEEFPDTRSRFLDEFVVISTSGSGRPAEKGIVVYDAVAWNTMNATAVSYFWPRGVRRGRKIKNAYYLGEAHHQASATSAIQSSEGFFDRLVVTMFDPVEELIAKLNAFQPDRLTSYSSTTTWLADLALDGILTISPQDVVVSSDRLTPYMEAKIKAAWNPNIYDLYAATESIFLALKPPGKNEWEVLEDLNIIEVIGADQKPVRSDERGRALLTNLYNFTIPLIRYDINDYVIQGDVEQGITMTIRGFTGRSFDNLPILLAGQVIGEIPSFELIEFSTIPGLDMLQFISHQPGYVEIEYCSKQNMDAVISRAFEQVLLRKGGSQTKFITRQVDHIWNDDYSGKLMLVRKPDEEQYGIPTVNSIRNIIKVSGEQPNRDEKNRGFPRSVLDESIPICFERQVFRRAETIAITDGAKTITYQELNQAANRIAHGLIDRKVGLCQPVALLFDHGAAMISAILGTLKAGCAYLPLDPSNPGIRNLAILDEVKVPILLTNTESFFALNKDNLRDVEIINIDEIPADHGNENPGLRILPQAPACILFTSGSTGKPKGVLLDHRAVLHRVMLYTNDYHIEESDHLTLLPLYVFNASLRDIFGALLNGAELHIFNVRKEGIHHLAPWMIRENITVLYMVPAVFRTFLQTLKKGDQFPQLRLIRLGGEVVLPKDVEGFQRHFGPGIVFANGLAATETGTTCQYFINNNSRIIGANVPVGYPIEDKRISLLDEKGNPVEPGEIGEMVVESSYLGPGYYTPGAFSRDSILQDSGQGSRIFHTGDMGYQLDDGCFVFVGRKDALVKIRGQRINLTEIEQALLLLENVEDAAVICRNRPDGGDFIAAYIQPKLQPAPSAEMLRQGLRRSLSEGMVPSVFILLEALPKTLGGKVDRQALPAPTDENFLVPETITPPETQIEEKLAVIWRKLLDLEQVDVERSFFDQGGDSLLASVLMASIEEEFDRNFPMAVLIQNNSIRKLAGLLLIEETDRSRTSMITLQEKGNKTPVFLIPGIEGEVLGLHVLISNMGVEHPIYGLLGEFFTSTAGNTLTMEQIAARYIREIRLSRPEGPYILVGYSFGGHIALEIGRQLLALGEDVPLVALLDTLPPVRQQNTTLFNRIMIHWENLRRQKSLQGYYNYFVERLRRILLRLIQNRSIYAVLEWLRVPVKGQLTAAQIALAMYEPPPYPGKVVLFKAKQREWYVTWDPMAAWRKAISGDLVIKEVHAEHHNLIRNPAAREVAQKLVECLEE